MTVKIETLKKRLSRLEESLYKEQKRLHIQIDNIGFGTGMRCTKCTPSFRHEDELKCKIEEVRDQISQLGSNE